VPHDAKGRGYQDPVVGVIFLDRDENEINEANTTCVPRVGDEVDLHDGSGVTRRVERVVWHPRTSTRGRHDNTLTACVYVSGGKP
jgi:hypothetical protein